MISEETFNEIKLVVDTWHGRENERVPADVIRQIFNLHNRVFPFAQEHSTGCGGCRERVWNRLKTWYWENKQNFEKDL